MADRWMDERDRKWREARERRPEQYGDSPHGERDEGRSFGAPQSDYDPYAEYRDDYDTARRSGWQGRHYGGVSPAMRQGEYQLERDRIARGVRFDRHDRDERETAAYKAGDFLGRAGRRVAEFFHGDHDGGPRSFRGHGPKGYKRSDERIGDDVNDRLTEDHWLDAREITVAVSGGEVTLGGTVDSRDAKRRAEQIAEDVSGVGHVQNNLRIATTEEHTAENESWQADIAANPLQSRNKGSGPN